MGIFVLIFVGCKNIKMAGTTISYNGLIEEWGIKNLILKLNIFFKSLLVLHQITQNIII
jgi:hypothetical protein